MVIQEIELENFKSFLTRQKLPLAPITLLYGPNGGGKSSVIQALLALRQSLQERAGRFVADGPDVQLGGFANAVSRHDTSKAVCISLKRPADECGPAWKSSKCEVRYGYDGKQDIAAVVTAMIASWTGVVSGTVMAELDPCSHVERIKMTGRGAGPWGLSSWAFEGDHLYRFSGSMEPLLARTAVDESTGNLLAPEAAFQAFLSDDRIRSHFVRLGSYGLPTELHDSHNGPWAFRHGELYHSWEVDPARRPPADSRAHVFWLMVADEWSSLVSELQHAMSGLVHVEPLRQQPQRVYHYNGLKLGSQNNLFPSQRHWADILKDQGYDDWCGEYMQQYGVPYKLRIQDVPVNGAMDLYQVLLEDLKTGSTVTLADVGFGVSQMLPIMAQGLAFSGPGKVIAVEQPELHLHPRLQAHLADFFIEFSCHSRAEKPLHWPLTMQSQWIIETHSEALIARLQRRVREGRISASDVSVLYLDKLDDLGTVVTPLRLDDNGDFIDEWPGGFFEDGFDDVFGGLT